ncbi:hypothetical protein [Bartonella sp. TS82HLJMH]|uniref:hypothetical protein n=1 Tax=Bartonella sp. TS82HLJMH TaxID=3243577 RepID=UPI0035D0BB40
MRDSTFKGIALYTILLLLCFGALYGLSVNIALRSSLGGFEWKKSRLWIIDYGPLLIKALLHESVGFRA